MRDDGEEGSATVAMSLINCIPAFLRALPWDGFVLFVTRFLRLVPYGALSVVLVFYLLSLSLTEAPVGLLLTLTLAGDIAKNPERRCGGEPPKNRRSAEDSADAKTELRFAVDANV
jgi:hypothetical protein